ncbi:MAG: hypothetical protein DCF13_01470 [Flavobacteriaceae bacterium]|nr:MAG: hypothetical protein DCF13_01470 [Flavobacteriaceae bacterium]
MENKDQISFGLRSITTEQFAIIESAFDKSNEKVELGNGLRFGFNLEKRSIIVLLSVNFNQDKGPFLILEIGCYFEIIKEDWDKLYNPDHAEIKLPIALARHLVVLAMGTLRGVLHAKVENTSFNMFLLPTINVTEFVKEDVVIKTNESIELK